MLDFDISGSVAGMLKVYRLLTTRTEMSFTPDTNIINTFHNFIRKEFKCSHFDNQWSWHNGLVPLSQISTTKNWTCDGPNRQLHVGRTADQRRWHRTLDSGRMDPAHYEVQQKRSYCDLVFSFYPVNDTHRDKPRNNTNCVVSFRLDCFTVLRTS